MDKLEVRNWDQYILNIETENNAKLDDDFKLQILMNWSFERIFNRIESDNPELTRLL